MVVRMLRSRPARVVMASAGAALGGLAAPAIGHEWNLDPNNGWGNVGTFVIITIVGLGLGAIRCYSKRLPPGMFTHAGYNAIIVTVAVLAR